jgi:hypothetical protein
MASPVLGPAGNAEFFLHARAHRTGRDIPGPLPDTVVEMISAAVAEAPDMDATAEPEAQ